MTLGLLFGFLVLVAASYIGTTLALRGFFGRERYTSPSKNRSGSPLRTDDQSSEPPRTDDRSGDERKNE